MEEKKLEVVIKHSEKRISILDWLFSKNPKCISLEVPRMSLDFLNDTIQAA